MADTADVLIRNADLPTIGCSRADRRTEAPDAVAVTAGKISAVGSAAELARLTDAQTQIIDAEGGALIPGINDAHLHFTALASTSFDSIDISTQQCASWSAVAEQIRRAATTRPDIIKAHGWDEFTLGPGGPEMLKNLDVDVPVVLFDQTGHQILANDVTLREAGITASTPDPDGGVISRNADGTPNGLFVDAAMALPIRAIPENTIEDIQRIQLRCQSMLHSLGITSITEPGLGPGGIGLLDGSPTCRALEALAGLAESNELTLRTNVLLLFDGTGGASAARTQQGVQSLLTGLLSSRNINPEILRIAGVKVFADGTPRSGTAWMSAPYGDDCAHGSMVVAGANEQLQLDELTEILRIIHEAGLQAGVHATGDATTSAVIDAVEAVQRGSTANAMSDPRHYVIHGAFDGPDAPRQLTRMAELGMGYSTNPLIRYQSGAGLERMLGKQRFEWHQPLASATKAGVAFTATSDAPVSSTDWRREIIAMVTRRTCDHDVAVNPAEQISPRAALASMTRNAAWQDHAETFKGSIALGQVADLCLLENAWPTDSNISELANNSVRNTWHNGTLVHGTS